MYACLAGLVWVSLMLAANPPTDAVKAEKEKLKGTWVLKVVGEGDVRDSKPDKWPEAWRGLRLTFTADRMIVRSDTLTKEKAVPYKIDPAQRPKALDIDGGGLKNEWIYKLRGDTLIVAFPLPLELVAGGTYAERERKFGRPRDFKATKERAASIIWVLKRVTP